MLSYQHAYHAGSLTDVHKHSALLVLLQMLGRRTPKLQYLETHAGRARYDLLAQEAEKTGEAKQGWLALQALPRLPDSLAAFGALNQDPQQYLGSPGLARRVLGPKARIHLAELHPAELAALRAWASGDKRIRVHHQDGYAMVQDALAAQKAPSLVLVDPSYEIKSEYQQAAHFARQLVQAHPQLTLALWYPMLSDGRHAQLEDSLRHGGQPALLSCLRFAPMQHKGGFGGTSGSGMVVMGPHLAVLRKALAATVKGLAQALPPQRSATASLTWLVKKP